MTLPELTNVIRTADIKAIHKQLLALGYIYCNNDEKLGKINVVDLFNGDDQQSDDVIDSWHKFIYDGCVTTNVKGFERYEFITIAVCKIRPSADPFEDEEAMQHEVRFYAKEI